MFVWTDQLADVVVRSGAELDARAGAMLTAWRQRPSAYRIPDDGDVMSLARALLDLEAALPDSPTCGCGMLSIAEAAS